MKSRCTPSANAGLLDRDGLLDSETLAEYLDVPVGTLDQWASRGGGPPFHKVGKFRRYHPSDVRTWLAGQRRVIGNGLPAA
jgi:excisionase family DNA binding protein